MNYNKDLKKRHSKKIFQKAGMYEWETPQDLFDKLNAEFHFTLDVCASKENAKCKNYYSEEDNALTKEWKGVCWMNPPYGRTIGKWIKKAYSEAFNGATIVCLIPSRTETNWWWNYCMKGEIRFLRGRLKFGGRNTKGEYVNYPATFGSAIVIFRNK
jgi:phage N-6-adenine-methyltransferase